jgi:hypothetical protein
MKQPFGARRAGSYARLMHWTDANPWNERAIFGRAGCNKRSSEIQPPCVSGNILISFSMNATVFGGASDTEVQLEITQVLGGAA